MAILQKVNSNLLDRYSKLPLAILVNDNSCCTSAKLNKDCFLFSSPGH